MATASVVVVLVVLVETVTLDEGKVEFALVALTGVEEVTTIALALVALAGGMKEIVVEFLIGTVLFKELTVVLVVFVVTEVTLRVFLGTVEGASFMEVAGGAVVVVGHSLPSIFERELIKPSPLKVKAVNSIASCASSYVPKHRTHISEWFVGVNSRLVRVL